MDYSTKQAPNKRIQTWIGPRRPTTIPVSTEVTTRHNRHTSLHLRAQDKLLRTARRNTLVLCCISPTHTPKVADSFSLKIATLLIMRTKQRRVSDQAVITPVTLRLTHQVMYTWQINMPASQLANVCRLTVVQWCTLLILKRVHNVSI